MKLIGQNDQPNSVNIHQLMVALILSRKKDSPSSKVHSLIKLILFEIEEGEVQATEVQYVFHLVTNHV